MRGRIATCLLLGCLVTGCGGSQVAPPASTPEPPATMRVGDVVMHASALQTASLPEATAKQYGLVADDATVLLVVGLRKGPEHASTSLEADVTATARDLLGRRQVVPLRALRSGDPGADGTAAFIDYVGSVHVSPPETLQFQVQARHPGVAPMQMRFSRDFFPIKR